MLNQTGTIVSIVRIYIEQNHASNEILTRNRLYRVAIVRRQGPNGACHQTPEETCALSHVRQRLYNQAPDQTVYSHPQPQTFQKPEPRRVYRRQGHGGLSARKLDETDEL